MHGKVFFHFKVMVRFGCTNQMSGVGLYLRVVVCEQAFVMVHLRRLEVSDAVDAEESKRWHVIN